MPSCHKPLSHNGTGLDFPYIAQIKYDGNMLYVIVRQGIAKFFTSGWKEIDFSGYTPFSNSPSGVYFIEVTNGVGKLGDRQKIGFLTTMRTRTAKNLPNDEFFPGFKIFDYVTLDDWYLEHSALGYRARLELIASRFAPEAFTVFSYVHDYIGLSSLMANLKSGGWEGLVLRKPDSFWLGTGKRNLDCLKLKHMETYDLRVVSEVPGTRRLTGKMGSLMLEDAEGRYVGSVGTGFDDSERVVGKYIGKVIEVKCERVSKDRVLIQPVFVSVREEKELDTIVKGA